MRTLFIICATVCVVSFITALLAGNLQNATTAALSLAVATAITHGKHL
jgi:hypothetical protein